jgi:SSS family solute:Na+ symporter
MIRLIAELSKDSLGGWLYAFADMNFLHFCIFLFLVCIVVMIVVSLFTPAPALEQIKGLTYATTVAADKARSRSSWNYKDVVLSVVIIIILVLVLLYFSPLIFS